MSSRWCSRTGACPVADLQTFLLGAEVDVLPGPTDEWTGTGVICVIWLMQPGEEPVTVPCFSVLFPDGLIAGCLSFDRLRVVKIKPLPMTTLVNKGADSVA